MTKATLETPIARTSDRTSSGRSSVLNSIWSLFAMTVVRQAVSRRSAVLAFLFLLPIAFCLLIRYAEFGFAGPQSGYQPLAAEYLVLFLLIPQALLPFTALVYASGMIQDEIEEQTITYLLIRPLPRWSIFLAKLLATIVVTVGLITVFTAITFLVIGWGEPNYWSSGGLARMAKTIVLYALSLAAYNTLFGFLSLLLKRAFLVGIAYIILLEGVAAFLDFAARKVAVMFYFRVLCERWMDLSSIWQFPSPMTFNIDMTKAPEAWVCLVTVLSAIAVLVVLSGIIMESREFRVKTPEGN